MDKRLMFIVIVTLGLLLMSVCLPLLAKDAGWQWYNETHNRQPDDRTVEAAPSSSPLMRIIPALSPMIPPISPN